MYAYSKFTLFNLILYAHENWKFNLCISFLLGMSRFDSIGFFRNLIIIRIEKTNLYSWDIYWIGLMKIEENRKRVRACSALGNLQYINPDMCSVSLSQFSNFRLNLKSLFREFINLLHPVILFGYFEELTNALPQ